jgi:hypothetical protein
MKNKILTALAALLLIVCIAPLQGCYDVEGPGWGGYGYGYPAYGSSWYAPSYAYGYGHPWYHDDWGYWGHGHHWDGDDWAEREGGFHGGHVGFVHGGGYEPGGGRAVTHSGHGGHHRG